MRKRNKPWHSLHWHLIHRAYMLNNGNISFFYSKQTPFGIFNYSYKIYQTHFPSIELQKYSKVELLYSTENCTELIIWNAFFLTKLVTPSLEFAWRCRSMDMHGFACWTSSNLTPLQAIEQLRGGTTGHYVLWRWAARAVHGEAQRWVHRSGGRTVTASGGA